MPKFRSSGGGLSASQEQNFRSTERKTLNPDELAGLQDAKKIMAHPAYMDESHPQHWEAIRAVKMINVGVYAESEAEAEAALRPMSPMERVLSRGVG